MKIAIHKFDNSLSDQWIPYLKERGIPYKLVDCFKSSVIEEVSDCTHLVWQWNQTDPKALLSAIGLTHALQLSGVKVYPDINTCWHFDNKVYQKYLLEAINAPIINSYVFYDEEEAIKWAKGTIYPKVFKLKGGAGSNNVKLVHTYSQAKRLIKTSFGSGFAKIDRKEMFRHRILVFKRNKNFKTLTGLGKGLARLLVPTELERVMGKDRGYCYFQDFIPGNSTDTRVIVIRNKAVAIKRGVREGDFRASGSGLISYDHKSIDTECIRIAFETAAKFNAQSVAFDFVHLNDKPLIVEISYGFAPHAYSACPGYWNHNLEFVHNKQTLGELILENLIEEYHKSLKKTSTHGS